MGPFGAFNGADGGNPFVSGLVNAVNIAGHIQQQGLAREQEARAQAKEARDAEIQTQNTQLQDADLSTRLSQMGAKPASNQDLIDSKTGALQNKIVKFGAKSWVLPTDEERDAKKATDFKTKLSQDTQEAEARANASEQGKSKALNDRLQQVGIPQSDEVTQMMGWPKGTRVLPEHLDDVARAVEAVKKADDLKNKVKEKKYSGIQTDDQGNATLIWDDGSTQKLGKIGKSKTDPSASPANQRLTDKATNDSKIVQAAGQIMLDPAAKDFKTADALLRERAKTDNFVKQNYLLIRKHIKDADKQTAAETNAETVDNLLGGDEAGASVSPAVPKKAAPAAPAAAAPAGGLSAAEFLKKRARAK